jgi:hypothetical protein
MYNSFFKAGTMGVVVETSVKDPGSPLERGGLKCPTPLGNLQYYKA